MKKDYIDTYEKKERDNWWWQARRKIIVDEIDRLSQGTKKRSLLDIGCGSGYTLKSLSEKLNCVGVEPDMRLLEIAKKVSGAKVVSGSLPDKLPEFNKKFDYVLLLDVLEHIKKDSEALVSLKKYLKPSSCLIINVPAMRWMWSIHDEINEHHKRYEREDLTEILTRAGFRIQKIRYWGIMLTLPALLIERKLMGEVFMPPRALNYLFYTYTTFEYRITQKISAPFGLSLLAIVKPIPEH